MHHRDACYQASQHNMPVLGIRVFFYVPTHRTMIYTDYLTRRYLTNNKKFRTRSACMNCTDCTWVDTFCKFIKLSFHRAWVICNMYTWNCSHSRCGVLILKRRSFKFSGFNVSILVHVGKRAETSPVLNRFAKRLFQT